MEKKEYSLELDGKNIVVEFSRLAEQANGSVLVKMDQTIVLATAVMGQQDRLEIDYMPLSVEYEEKYYAAGKIYGSRFVRRESRPSENAILTGRLIDRTLRPLFNQKLRRDIQVVVTCLSIDEKNDPDIIGILAASLSLLNSDISWGGPVAGVRIGWSQEKGFLINPQYADREGLSLEIVASGTETKINMIETQANEVSEDIIEQGLALAQEKIKKLIDFQNQIAKEMAKEKKEMQFVLIDSKLEEYVKHFLSDKLETAVYAGNKKSMNLSLNVLNDLLYKELLSNSFTDRDFKIAKMVVEEEIDKLVHKNILDSDKRPDGRKLDEVRALDIMIDVLPRAHGSALFMRGTTQALSVITLGSTGDVLTIQGMEVTGTKRFMHHYNFPPFCSGETGRLGSPGRREIGHGALAEKALIPMIPEKEVFPYTIRAVTEILSSNGSTSMASACATSLSLMAAGVPIKELVAGIAMGLMSDETRYKILTDIQGPEDHFGDMDCKVAGTKNGITAMQMDVKISGVTSKIIREVMEQSKKARLEILEKMRAVISEPRKEMSSFAPRITTMEIDPSKIGGVIGAGGKTINQIIADTGVAIDIEDTGLVYITSPDEESSLKAKKIIEEIVREYKVGDIIDGKVSQLKEFGAIIDINPWQDGLLHISEMANYRVNKVEDVVKIDDVLILKITKIENGRLGLSLKAMQPGYEEKPSYPKPRFDRRTPRR